MLEKEIVAAVLRLLKGHPHCYAWKEHGGMYGTAGIPDVIACVNGRFVALEVKRPGNKPTPLQRATLEQIQKAGGLAAVVTSKAEAEAVLREGGLA